MVGGDHDCDSVVSFHEIEDRLVVIMIVILSCHSMRSKSIRRPVNGDHDCDSVVSFHQIEDRLSHHMHDLEHRHFARDLFDKIEGGPRTGRECIYVTREREIDIE